MNLAPASARMGCALNPERLQTEPCFKAQGHTDWTKEARTKAGVISKPPCCDPVYY